MTLADVTSQTSPLVFSGFSSPCHQKHALRFSMGVATVCQSRAPVSRLRLCLGFVLLSWGEQSPRGLDSVRCWRASSSGHTSFGDRETGNTEELQSVWRLGKGIPGPRASTACLNELGDSRGPIFQPWGGRYSRAGHVRHPTSRTKPMRRVACRERMFGWRECWRRRRADECELAQSNPAMWVVATAICTDRTALAISRQREGAGVVRGFRVDLHL